MTRVDRRSAVFGFSLAAVLALAWQGTLQVRAQDPGMPWLSAACDFADAVSSGDMSTVAQFTTPEYQAYLVTALHGQPPHCQLTGRGLTQNGQHLSATYASVQLVCRHPNGVEEIVTVAVRLTDGAWKVCGGFDP